MARKRLVSDDWPPLADASAPRVQILKAEVQPDTRTDVLPCVRGADQRHYQVSWLAGGLRHGWLACHLDNQRRLTMNKRLPAGALPSRDRTARMTGLARWPARRCM
jgi:hypothetical protein